MAGVFKSPVPPVQIEGGNLISYVFGNSHRWNDKPALVCGKTSRTLTFAELQHQMGVWGAWLMRCDHFKVQDTVVSALSNMSLDFAVIQLGTMAQGGIFSAFHQNFSPSEIAKEIDSSKSGLIVVSGQLEPVLQQAFKVLGRSVPVINMGRYTIGDAIANFADIIADPSLVPLKPVNLTGEERLTMLYTSGSTGLPKCVQLSHNNAIYGSFQPTLQGWCAATLYKDAKQFRILLTRNFGLAFGFICCLLPALRVGACQIVINGTDDQLLHNIAKFKINQTHIITSSLAILLRIPTECPSVLEHFKFVFVSGAPIIQLYDDAMKETMPGVTLQKCYGMSEAGIVALDPLGSSKAAYTGLLAANVQAKVLSISTGAPLAALQDGIIHVNCPFLMIGYYNEPEKTKEMIDEDGWFNTGDVGHIDNDGYVKIVDRQKDIMITTGGVNVAPSELENALLQHPLVTHACVVGVTQPLTGLDDFVAFVATLHPTKLTEQAVKDVIKENFNESKHLKRVVILNALPRNNNNKVDRRQLKIKAAGFYKMQV